MQVIFAPNLLNYMEFLKEWDQLNLKFSIPLYELNGIAKDWTFLSV